MQVLMRPMTLVSMAALLLAAACQSSRPSRTSPASAGSPHPSLSSAPTSPDEIVETAPAAMRLQDIGGYILLFYREYQKMPPTLADLRTTAGGQDLNFISPSTGQPFAYIPTGLWSPEQSERCIIAYDPGRMASGKRWCLFMTLPKAGAALSVDVVALPEPIFLNYQRQ
jgi:hypothetical protein